MANTNQNQLGFDTRAIHAGYTPDPTTGAAVPPIYQSNAFVFEDCKQGAARFALAENGPIYSRLTNPTVAVVEERLASLEGGVGALLTSSGAGAIAAAILTIAQEGDNIISSSSLYGGSIALLGNSLPRYGIETRFVSDPGNPEAWKALADERTVAFFGETIPNPKNDILDIEAIAEAAHEVGVPLIVDNTVATPYLVRPIEWGADIVIHSVTKYLSGHGNSLSGAIIDGGKFDWAADPQRFRQFSAPDPSYHGLIYSDLGEAAFILKARVQILRDFGFAPSPLNAWLSTLGIETLSLRLDRHSTSALAVAKFLAQHELVAKVSYAALDSSPYKKLQEKYAPKGASGIVTFDISGGREAGEKFVDSLQIFHNLANIGDVRSLVAHPASTTHSQCSEEELAAAGISGGTVRLSIGLEDVTDLIADLEQAFNHVRS
ncbi:O-acetylhomoserine aminocarboxypropyltransferase/cysteine synthase family protein [Arcanobacterium hippocoleae]